MRQKENIEETNYCDWLRDEYPFPAIALKLVLFVGRGFPDRTVLTQGRIFFIEFKRPGKGLEPKQREWRKILIQLGFKVYVCTSFEKAKARTLKVVERS